MRRYRRPTANSLLIGKLNSLENDNGLITKEFQEQAKKAVSDLFQTEELRIQAFTIAAVNTKIEIAERMFHRLKKVEEKLFSDTKIESTNDLKELLSMFCVLVDKLLALCATIDKSHEAIKTINGGVSSWASGALEAKQQLLNPEMRKRVSLVYHVLISEFAKMGKDSSTLPALRTLEIENPAIAPDKPNEANG